jgi:hypothetical protein
MTAEPTFNGAYYVYVKFEDFDEHGNLALPDDIAKVLEDMRNVSENNFSRYKVTSKAACLPPRVAESLFPYVKAVFTPIRFEQYNGRGHTAGHPVRSYWMDHESV